MPPNNTNLNTLHKNDVDSIMELPMQGSLQGTFHNPDMPDALAMTTYVAPSTQGFPSYAIGSPSMWVDSNSAEASSMFPYMTDASGERHPIAQYTECKADSGVDQINGVVIVCDHSLEDMDIKTPRGKYYYKGCKKLGAGSQVNGMELVYPGGGRVPRLPSMPGRWDNVDMLNSEGKEIKGMPKNQINGGRIRLMKRTEMGGFQ